MTNMRRTSMRRPTPRAHFMRVSALALALGAGLSACGGMSLYDVRRAQVEDCDITPGGEFCSEGGPSIDEKFAVEVREEHTVVYFGDETWILPGTTGLREAVKEEQATRPPGPCTTSARRELAVDVQGPVLTGTYQESTRVEGPAACGETPRGTKKRYTLTGSITNSI